MNPYVLDILLWGEYDRTYTGPKLLQQLKADLSNNDARILIIRHHDPILRGVAGVDLLYPNGTRQTIPLDAVLRREQQSPCRACHRIVPTDTLDVLNCCPACTDFPEED